jgi:hypothetical protein
MKVERRLIHVIQGSLAIARACLVFGCPFKLKLGPVTQRATTQEIGEGKDRGRDFRLAKLAELPRLFSASAVEVTACRRGLNSDAVLLGQQCGICAPCFPAKTQSAGLTNSQRVTFSVSTTLNLKSMFGSSRARKARWIRRTGMPNLSCTIPQGCTR